MQHCFPFTHDWGRYGYSSRRSALLKRKGCVYVSTCRKCGKQKEKVLK